MSPQTTLLIDLFQFGLDMAGILDPTGAADATSGIMSLVRGRFFDAGVSAVSLLPYLGDVAKFGKIPRYLKTVRYACQLGLADLKFGRKLLPIFPEILKVLKKMDSVPLPSAVRRQLVEVEEEITRFLMRYEKAVLSGVKIPALVPKGLIANTKLVEVTQQALRNEFLRSGLREAHNAHFFMRLVERGPKCGINTVEEFARQFNRGTRYVGELENTVKVLLIESNAKVIVNLNGELISFVIGDLSKMIL